MILLPQASPRSPSGRSRDPAGQKGVISGEALSSGPWPEYLTSDWLIHIPGVELGDMLRVRHGAQRFLSNSTTSACPRREVQLRQEWGGGVRCRKLRRAVWWWGERDQDNVWDVEEHSASGGPTVHVNYQFFLWIPPPPTPPSMSAPGLTGSYF